MWLARPRLRATSSGALIVAGWVTLAACGGASPDAARVAAAADTSAATTPAIPADVARGLISGEAMTFEVTMGGVVAGEAAFAVGEPGDVDGRKAITVRSRIASAGAFALIKDIRDEMTTVVDLARGLPLSMHADVFISGRRVETDARFAGSTVTLAARRDGGEVRQSVMRFDDVEPHDAHTAMAMMRMWDPAAGDGRRLWIVGGRRLWRADVRFTGHESIGTRLGNRRALRLDGVSQRTFNDRSIDSKRKPRVFTVWLSDDADRVPLRVVAYTELGDVVIELTDYRRP